MPGRLIGTMPQMTQPKDMDDPRLWAVAYVEFFVQDANADCRESRRLLERDAGYMARAVGNFAYFLMDSVWLPANYRVDWTTSWVEVDSLRRTNPALRRMLVRRDRYRRIGKGYSLFPRRALRRTARDVVGMLWLAYQVESLPDSPALYGSAPVVEMLHRYRKRFGHMSGPGRNA